MSRFSRFLEAKTYSGMANALFGGLSDRVSDSLHDLEIELEKADMSVLFRTYVSEMLMTSTLTFLVVLAAMIAVNYLYSFGTMLEIMLTLSVPYIAAASVFGIMYFIPFQRSSSRENSIDRNLPFALNQMAAVAGSGVPPVAMFDLLTEFEEYGEISSEASRILRKVDVFGEDFTTALKEAAQVSPSDRLTDVFHGMISTVETGGDLGRFLKQQAESALFEYRLARERQIENLSTYASFYTALLVAAPLFLIAVLSVLNLIGGDLLGFAIQELMELGIYVIVPSINIGFLLVLEMTQEVF
ncbi:MAG: type II secretion system F family protein [Candidatus Nanohaloarchaea archaeon]|nr:type II secretion system F family protein [Candidatus Nanohaloarchaea archaeon]